MSTCERGWPLFFGETLQLTFQIKFAEIIFWSTNKIEEISATHSLIYESKQRIFFKKHL